MGIQKNSKVNLREEHATDDDEEDLPECTEDPAPKRRKKAVATVLET